MASTIRGSDNFDSANLLGVGQMWQDMSASRAAYTDYTNNTGRPISVHVACSMNGGRLRMTIGGVILDGSDINAAGEGSTITAIVPDATIYRIDGFGSSIATVDSWVELR